MAEPYIKWFPALDLEIRYETAGVPADGEYYVLVGGEVTGAFLRLRKAQERYKRYVDESGWRPPRKGELSPED